ncbi:PA0069 family radical SAM protein [Gimesia sp.]|uniref:PA0069 family radical SAM protein n=1 Tax=Gimesia sp. TaxID=2024833 RepID=UPI003A951C7E
MRHGSNIDPPNRFAEIHRELDFEHLEWDQEYLNEQNDRKIVYFDDISKSIVSENRSSDIPFKYSVNPYRGCIHACSYCYARNSHEYLGLNAGLDFETKIMVKHNAADLLREFLRKDGWIPEPISFSGVTDCYQPAERKFRLTRQCLTVANECNLPLSIITKNALILRDADILEEMAQRDLVHVSISISTIEIELARAMEPRASIPPARIRTIKELSDRNIPVRVLVAPIIPGLNDHSIPKVLEEAKAAGACDAQYILLRLPLTVKPVFLEWLERTQPLKSKKVQNLICETRGGKLNESSWRQRMTGSGVLAEQIKSMFTIFRNKYDFGGLPQLVTSKFLPPKPINGQLRLF